jgi:mono/diheme cytochrome c family protein
VGAWLVLAPCAAPAAEPEPPTGPAAPPAQALDHLLSTPPAPADAAPVPPSPVADADRRAVSHLVNPMVGDAAGISKGRLLFAANCQVCHGSASEGPPPDSGFNPPPRDFRSAAFHAARSDGELFYVIRHGVDGTAMLPWEGRLTDREIWMLVTYIRTRAGTTP